MYILIHPYNPLSSVGGSVIFDTFYILLYKFNFCFFSIFDRSFELSLGQVQKHYLRSMWYLYVVKTLFIFDVVLTHGKDWYFKDVEASTVVQIIVLRNII